MRVAVTIDVNTVSRSEEISRCSSVLTHLPVDLASVQKQGVNSKLHMSGHGVKGLKMKSWNGEARVVPDGGRRNRRRTAEKTDDLPTTRRATSSAVDTNRASSAGATKLGLWREAEVGSSRSHGP